MKKTNGLLISVLVVGVLVLVALVLNLAQGGLWIISGRNGKNAYELAVQNGFTGSLQEWLDSLAGADGVNGSDGSNGTNGTDGRDGKNGTNGKSAYEIAVDNGFRGTLQEWVLSLSFGKDGADGKDGEKGADGKNGKDGKDGKDGRDGVSIRNVWINENGHLMVSLSDGSQLDAGSWEGITIPTPSEKSDFQKAQESGYTGTLHEWLCAYNTATQDELKISDVRRNSEGQLILTLKNGTTVNAGKLPADGFLSDAVDANGFRPRFEQVVMNYEASGLNLRSVPGDTNSSAVTTISPGITLICIGSKEIDGSLYYQFFRNGQNCYAKAKYFDLKYDYYTELQRMNLPDKLVIRAGEPFRFVTEEIVPWADASYGLFYAYSNEAATWTEDDVSVSLTTLFADGTVSAPHAKETGTLRVALCTVEGIVLLTHDIEVTVVPQAELPKLVGMFIGDSRVASGNLLSSFAEQAGEHVQLIGTLQNSAGIAHEGRGAWSAGNYLNSHDKYGSTNAFYNPDEKIKRFDFRYYMKTYYPDTHLDFVVINLGANDVFSAASVADIDSLVASIHAYDPAIQVLVMTEYIAPERGEPFYADLTRRRQFVYYERMREILAGREDKNIRLVPSFLSVDTWGDRMLKQDENGASAVADYVHLGSSGYAREAAVIVTWLADLFSE